MVDSTKRHSPACVVPLLFVCLFVRLYCLFMLFTNNTVDGTRGHSPASAVPLLLFSPPHLLIIFTLCHLFKNIQSRKSALSTLPYFQWIISHIFYAQWNQQHSKIRLSSQLLNPEYQWMFMNIYEQRQQIPVFWTLIALKSLHIFWKAKIFNNFKSSPSSSFGRCIIFH